MKTWVWSKLSATERTDALRRPTAANDAVVDASVARIIDQVRVDGDLALKALTRRFDQVSVDKLRLDESEMASAASQLSSDLREAIDAAIGTLERYHRETLPKPFEVETAPGVRCGRMIRPIETVGLYVPAGTAPLPSTVLMLGVPAMLAGCPNVVLCSPPRPDGTLDSTVLAAARALGISQVFRVGGAQAIAAMAFGTESIPKCDKIFGPGNAYVTRAKQLVAQATGGAAIDMPAGPSEVLVIADETARPEFVASDLLSQAEHGVDSQVILVTTDPALASAVGREVEAQLADLPRADIARQSIDASLIVIASDLDEAVAISNEYAPEHLILQVASASDLLEHIRAAGSVFVGPWAPESLGDYCSGTNHVLPTAGWARATSGVSVDSFVNRISVQEVDRQGIATLGPIAEILASAEGLDAHRRAVSLRLAALREEESA